MKPRHFYLLKLLKDDEYQVSLYRVDGFDESDGDVHVIEAPDITAIKAELVDVMMYSDEENTEEQILTVLQRHLGME